jgi:hypothetical protein
MYQIGEADRHHVVALPATIVAVATPNRNGQGEQLPEQGRCQQLALWRAGGDVPCPVPQETSERDGVEATMRAANTKVAQKLRGRSPSTWRRRSCRTCR